MQVKFVHADNEEFDETAWMHRLICVFVGRACPKGTFFDVTAQMLSVWF